jgi:hypothetical protein
MAEVAPKNKPAEAPSAAIGKEKEVVCLYDILILLNVSVSKSKETLIETRGQGGYIVAPETPGYSFIQGDFTTIPNITEIDRDILFN